MTSSEIRQQFLDFFRSKGHEIVPSSPVVPHDDPTLMFTNAGMNQFKDVFLGSGTRPYKRAADTQKCIRAGGKHNDLDDVGQDTYHHTFFEMLGNWSFGDYFKAEAIEWAWELLTGIFKIDPERLYATYFEGDAAENLEPDTEARDLWRKILPAERVVPGNKKDNFWEMGDTGPCGPCSEIHIDLTPDRSGAKLVNAGDARVMEIWNLVFIQFNRGADGKLTPLPAKHVDTGMGFERLCAVLQGMEHGKLGRFSNYDTDVFTPVFDAIRRRTKAPPYTATLPDNNNADQTQRMVDVSYRVIADHVRCLTFALTDGAIPSNEGRGYVLRRILRRAVRYGRQYLNMHEPFLCDLVQPLVEHMGPAFPELRRSPAYADRNVARVTELFRDEESSFLRTLDRGIRLFNEAADHAAKHHHGRISGEDAFKLHDTYGFPIDLTELMAEERGMTVNFGEYERLMEAARHQARAAGSAVISPAAALTGDLIAQLPASIEFHKYSQTTLSEAEVIAILRIRIDGTIEVLPNVGDALYKGERGLLVLDNTCFYAEQGGQVGDRGTIGSGSEDEDLFLVQDTIRAAHAVLHVGVVYRGAFAYREPVHMSLDARRGSTMQNHTATHVMNWALREVLERNDGGKVDQKGSLVDPEKTRFDFSHNKPVSTDELARIESLCNEQIRKELPVFAASKEEDFVDQAAARRINTLRAVFGEKYPDKVRVVSIGAPIDELLADPTNDKWMKYSVEFCGGTHVKNTKEIEHFTIISEEGVAKGVRRVVGISGEAAKTAIERGQELLAEAEALIEATKPSRARKEAVVEAAGDLPTQVADLLRKVAEAVIPVTVRHQLQQRLADLQKLAKGQAKEQAAATTESVLQEVAALFEQAETIAGVTLVAGQVTAAGPDALRQAIDWVRQKTESSAVFLASANEGKATLIAGISKAALEKGLRAGDLIKQTAPMVGGKGGGRPDMAQGGGDNPEGIPQALEAAKQWLKCQLASG